MRVLKALAIFSAMLCLTSIASADPVPADSAAPPAQAATQNPAQVAPPATAANTQIASPSSQTQEHVLVQQTAGKDDEAGLNEIVCRSEAPATGTRLGGRRECHTVRQWNQRQYEQQRMVQMQQRTGDHQSN
ncbi:MAG TPA: hypothetical protein VGK90_11210 [Rhizomicrobium sp.]|jgi:hypothetical protein